MKLDFCKTTPGSSYTPGNVYFDDETHTVKVATAANRYVVYSGVRSAIYDDSTNVLTIVNEEGEEYEITISSLPAVTSADNGKILQVVNGVWSLAEPVSIYTGTGEPSNILGSNGDIYIQS